MELKRNLMIYLSAEIEKNAVKQKYSQSEQMKVIFKDRITQASKVIKIILKEGGSHSEYAGNCSKNGGTGTGEKEHEYADLSGKKA